MALAWRCMSMTGACSCACAGAAAINRRRTARSRARGFRRHAYGLAWSIGREWTGGGPALPRARRSAGLPGVSTASLLENEAHDQEDGQPGSTRCTPGIVGRAGLQQLAQRLQLLEERRQGGPEEVRWRRGRHATCWFVSAKRQRMRASSSREFRSTRR